MMLPMTSTNSQKLDSWIHISEVLVWMKSVIDFKLLSRPVLLEKKVRCFISIFQGQIMTNRIKLTR